MVAHAYTVAFEGVDVRNVNVQVQLANGVPTFQIVGLPDKAVGEARERVRSALSALGLALPPKRIVVNMAPADLPKEGSHYDLPIALALLAAMDVVPREDVADFVALGELSLDGSIVPVSGILPAAFGAQQQEKSLICPAACGSEATIAGDFPILAPGSLLALINHFKGQQILAQPEPFRLADMPAYPDLRDVKGQELAKRALEVAAAGGHHLLMSGPPGAGKSMMAARLPGLLPPMSAEEALETSMITSLAAAQDKINGRGFLQRHRPFRSPHHSASMPALVGGGTRAKPGEISLAHNGVLFLDELAEFSRPALEALRQPLESGECLVSRANAHVRYPARVQLIAAMNPCRCGHMNDPAKACSRAPRCGQDYLNRISGPILDRMDLRIDVPAVLASDLSLPPPVEGSAEAAVRVSRAREIQKDRFRQHGIRTNAEAEGVLLDEVATPEETGRHLLNRAAEKFGLTARGYYRVIRVARTLADLSGSDEVKRMHVAEALEYRRTYS